MKIRFEDMNNYLLHMSDAIKSLEELDKRIGDNLTKNCSKRDRVFDINILELFGINTLEHEGVRNDVASSYYLLKEIINDNSTFCYSTKNKSKIEGSLSQGQEGFNLRVEIESSQINKLCEFSNDIYEKLPQSSKRVVALLVEQCNVQSLNKVQGLVNFDKKRELRLDALTDFYMSKQGFAPVKEFCLQHPSEFLKAFIRGEYNTILTLTNRGKVYHLELNPGNIPQETLVDFGNTIDCYFKSETGI